MIIAAATAEVTRVFAHQPAEHAAPAALAAPDALPAPSSASAQSQPPLLAPHLFIEFDRDSQRFVQTVIDGESKTVLRRFPAENQLAFSRGVNAYLRALSQS